MLYPKDRLKTKIETIFRIVRSEYCSAGQEIDSVSISEKNIEELINKLENKEIRISREKSVKKVKGPEGYIPFPAVLDQKLFPVEIYKLDSVNHRLTIEIKDYDNSSGFNPERIGGMYHKEAGVECIIRYEGTYEEGKVTETVRKILGEFYQPPASFPKRLLEKEAAKISFPKSL